MTIPAWPMPELRPETPKQERWIDQLCDTIRQLRREALPLAFSRWLASMGDQQPPNLGYAYNAFVERYNADTEDIVRKP